MTPVWQAASSPRVSKKTFGREAPPPATPNACGTPRSNARTRRRAASPRLVRQKVSTGTTVLKCRSARRQAQRRDPSLSLAAQCPKKRPPSFLQHSCFRCAFCQLCSVTCRIDSFRRSCRSLPKVHLFTSAREGKLFAEIGARQAFAATAKPRRDRRAARGDRRRSGAGDGRPGKQRPSRGGGNTPREAPPSSGAVRRGVRGGRPRRPRRRARASRKQRRASRAARCCVRMRRRGPRRCAVVHVARQNVLCCHLSLLRCPRKRPPSFRNAKIDCFSAELSFCSQTSFFSKAPMKTSQSSISAKTSFFKSARE